MDAPPLRADVAVVGAGAAGLMAAIACGRHLAPARPDAVVVALDGARTLGAKVLVAGGGRCNVTHAAVTERDYSGSTPPAIRRILQRFTVEATVDFFRDLGVELKQEPTRKLFPTTDRARTVLDALVTAARDAGARLMHPWRVASITRTDPGFVLMPEGALGPDAPDRITARRVILAAGGMALPKSGSDGSGYSLARSLGHTTTQAIFPALVPLTLPEGHPLRQLAGISAPVTLELRAAPVSTPPDDALGKRLREWTGSLLCTHFGLSGPVILDASRHWLDPRAVGSVLVANWLPGVRPEEADALLVRAHGCSIARWITDHAPRRIDAPGVEATPIPERLARTLCEMAGVDGGAPISSLSREHRRALVRVLTSLALPVTGHRGFVAAEATAGGVPLAQVDLHTLESRVAPGVHLCGEILDVDGRLGGFNFQWAWASGQVAGQAAAEALIGGPGMPPPR